ncbi:sorting nexin-22 isoform X2 [Ascaphus truei]|uniref:sorting nexin-22 isoform X2 n=1 Tax=Ascaphus truei TaxID=8439 RepID=UPI003F59CBE2
MIEVYVPSVGHQIQPPAKARTVFVVDVLWNGRRHTLERRYSEFHTLHKRLKKSCKVPDFPPKRLADWKCKVQERRRQGLEAYIQGVLWYNQDVPKELLDFLKLKHFQQSHETCSSESLADSAAEESRSQLTHRAVLGFYTDLYVFPPDTGETPRCPGERRHTRGTARILPTAQEPTQSQEDAPCKDSTFSTQSTVKNY